MRLTYNIQLSSDFFDGYETLIGGRKSDDRRANLRSQLMCAVRKPLLDVDFVGTCMSDIAVNHPDGDHTPVLPPLFTYATDYPEKALLAAVRNMGTCPCTSCEASEKIPDI
ncbi:unnamed protein product [Peniophora sp. CBMAI 1063]|nr:unnamed protein product [Peniophora sp. CBMAI 1063]